MINVLVIAALLAVIAGDVGVNDDYYLDAQVSFSCPLPAAVVSYNLTDDSNSTYYYAGDDYYGAKVGASYPGFVFFYTWMCFVTVFPLLFFAYNNRFAPIGEVKAFIPESKSYIYITDHFAVYSTLFSLV